MIDVVDVIGVLIVAGIFFGIWIAIESYLDARIEKKVIEIILREKKKEKEV